MLLANWWREPGLKLDFTLRLTASVCPHGVPWSSPSLAVHEPRRNTLRSHYRLLGALFLSASRLGSTDLSATHGSLAESTDALCKQWRLNVLA